MRRGPAVVLAAALAASACSGLFVAPEPVVSGRVLRARGRPVAGAAVWATDPDRATVTGPDGSFVLGRVRPGAVVRVRADGYGPLDWPVPAAGAASLRLAVAAADDFDPQLFRQLTGRDEPWARSRWPDGEVRYVLQALEPEPEQAVQVTSESLDRWAMLTGGRVRFVRVPSPPARLSVRLRESDPCGLKETVGCTVVVSSGAEILGAATEVLVAHASKPWVMLHLLGYAVGLDVSPNPDDVMHARPPQVDWPSDAEAAVVSALYGNLPLAGLPLPAGTGNPARSGLPTTNRLRALAGP